MTRTLDTGPRVNQWEDFSPLKAPKYQSDVERRIELRVREANRAQEEEVGRERGPIRAGADLFLTCVVYCVG